MTIKYKITNMMKSSNRNLNEKVEKKIQKYLQLAYEIRKRRSGYGATRVVVDAKEGGENWLKEQIDSKSLRNR